jgi:hypothetical protein
VASVFLAQRRPSSRFPPVDANTAQTLAARTESGWREIAPRLARPCLVADARRGANCCSMLLAVLGAAGWLYMILLQRKQKQADHHHVSWMDCAPAAVESPVSALRALGSCYVTLGTLSAGGGPTLRPRENVALPGRLVRRHRVSYPWHRQPAPRNWFCQSRCRLPTEGILDLEPRSGVRCALLFGLSS